MSAAAFFNAARSLKRELTGNAGIGLTQEEVDALNAVVRTWKPERPSEPFQLADPAAFFQSIKDAHGSLAQEQVDGFNALLTAMGKARWPISWTAYGLATAWWETNKTMQPVEEAYYLGAKAKTWRQANLRYYPHYGRGYVQLTWPKNYAWADEECGLNGALVADLSLAMQPDIAAQIMVKGMEQGAFTGRKLADYLPISGRAGHDAYKLARRIINGNDKADIIAKLALGFEAALAAGEWG